MTQLINRRTRRLEHDSDNLNRRGCDKRDRNSAARPGRTDSRIVEIEVPWVWPTVVRASAAVRRKSSDQLIADEAEALDSASENPRMSVRAKSSL
jgi:hypothetical protein